MITPNNEVFQAIVNLSRSNEHSWKIFVAWLNASWQGHLIISAQTENEVRSRWMQGRSQELGDLLKFILNAEDALKQQTSVSAEKADTPNKFD